MEIHTVVLIAWCLLGLIAGIRYKIEPHLWGIAMIYGFVYWLFMIIDPTESPEQ